MRHMGLEKSFEQFALSALIQMAFAVATSFPSTTILPFVGAINLVINLPVVDFPQPLSPTKLNVVPSSISKETSITALTYCFLK